MGARRKRRRGVLCPGIRGREMRGEMCGREMGRRETRRRATRRRETRRRATRRREMGLQAICRPMSARASRRRRGRRPRTPRGCHHGSPPPQRAQLRLPRPATEKRPQPQPPRGDDAGGWIGDAPGAWGCLERTGGRQRQVGGGAPARRGGGADG
eukprot:scaffold23596_cov90-Isochrysis_galbana.AAC.1